MSAESPRRSRTGGPLIVPPQPPCDRTLMDTVSGFINDVTLTSSPNVDPKDIIQWARFESADLNEPKSDSDGDGDIQPLLLIIGYGSGIQVWVIQPGGEAQEALSWRQGSVRILRVLPTPSYGDYYSQKRPLIALCDSTGPGAPYCSLSFISLAGGDQVKSIKFKNPILDVVANKRSIVVSFAERLAVFDACKLEDRLTVTTCYPSPCPLGGLTPGNPLSLGDRWLAYAERRLSPTKKSSGGCEGEGVASYTATVLHAAKSLGKGLRGLGESVASSLGGARSGVLSQSPSPPNTEQLQPGVVTIIDLENWKLSDEGNTELNDDVSSNINDSVIAHFIAHSEPIVALKFDASGMILITADKRGHDFHVFRIHPHPSGPNLASVHHLYILHRGDTTAKVQDITISFDCRWVAVSTLRGTVHVFPITPYGGAVGVRTHASPHVVNRLSRFHRSAGLAADGRSSSPVGENIINGAYYPNPRLPPFPAPSTIHPLAQLRPAPAFGAAPSLPTHTITRNSAGRQRLSSLSEEGQLPLVVCARWGGIGRVATGVTRARGLPSPPATQALYVMSGHGNLIQYYLHPKHASGVPKEKVCDDTSIEVEVEAKAQWPLVRSLSGQDIIAPLPSHHILIKPNTMLKNACDKSFLDSEDRWLSQVEIMTHAGPHRRLWMGPQFVFKTYNAASGTSLSLLDSDAVEVGTGPTVTRSNPVNMPGSRPIVPVLIESGSASSLEHSPRLSDAYRKVRDGILGKEGDDGHKEGEVRLKEDLAEAMRETDQGCEWTLGGWTKDEEFRAPHVHRIVNPLGTVVSGASSSSPSPPSEGDSYILSNEDEALFRPVVRAPRSLPAPTTPPTRPLSSRTLLPAQHVSVPAENSSISTVPAAALTDTVVIPAKLSLKQLSLSSSKETNENSSDVNAKSINTPRSKVVEQEDDSNAFEEFSMASNEIQFCNNEVVGNIECERDIHITAYQFEDILENTIDQKYDVSVADIYKCDTSSKDIEFIDVVKEPEHIDISEFDYDNHSKDLVEDEAVKIEKESTVLDDKLDNKKEENWEVLTDTNTVEFKNDNIKETLKEIKKNNSLNDLKSIEFKNKKEVVNEIKKNNSFNDLKSKSKKNKKGKPKSCNMIRSNSPVKNDFVESEVMDSTLSEPLPMSSLSWNEKYEIPNLVSLTSEDDSVKVSTKYNKTNLVVANCDVPSELCFVEGHHSFVQEMSEPVNFVVGDDDNLEYQHAQYAEQDRHETAESSDVTVLKDGDEDAFETTDVMQQDNGVEVLEKEIEDSLYNGISMEERVVEVKSNAIEKSSDEENISQADSDDCVQVLAPNIINDDCERNFVAEVELPEVESVVNNTQAAKSSKKKSKRKRR